MHYYGAKSLVDDAVRYYMFAIGALILMSGILILANERCGCIMAMCTIVLHIVIIHGPTLALENIKHILIGFL